jgi:formate hydrogenlyase subunit 6/NADH:ubiquinone oxidoreductase subunit I
MAILRMAFTVLKALVRRPSTRQYPFHPARKFTGTRGTIRIDIGSCIFCGICSKKCPTHAIAVFKDTKVWEIDRMRCISCGYCTEVCPKKCLLQDTEYAPCAYNKQKDIFKSA